MSVVNTSLRFWPDAIIPIINGKAPTEYEDFHRRAEMLKKFRERSKEPLPIELTDNQSIENCIKDFYGDYCAITQLVDLSDRVNALSKSRFIQAVSTYKEGLFDELEKDYLEVYALPGGLKATPGGVELLENQKAKELLRIYYSAISSPKIIRNNVNTYRGLSEEQKKDYSSKRGLASGWFQHYPKTVTKETVACLKQALKMESLGISNENTFAGNMMRPYFQHYVELAEEYRRLDDKQPAIDKNGNIYQREQAYWDSLQSNLKQFIKDIS